MKLTRVLVLLAVLGFSQAQLASAEVTQKDVPASSVGVGDNSTVVAKFGSVVYARKGSNVQYWPGSKLVSVKNAASIPACSNSSVTASGRDQELNVASGAEACTVGDTAVIAFEGSTVIYDEDVPLIHRPVRRR